jgi:hypothetical protein
LTRIGQPCSQSWVALLEMWTALWQQAGNNVAEPTGPHTDHSFRAYLSWYIPRTRARMTYADTQPQVHQATVADLYPRHHDEALAGAVSLLNLFQCSNFASSGLLIIILCCASQLRTGLVLDTDISTYQTRIRRGSPMTDVEQLQAWGRTQQHLRSILHGLGTRADYDDTDGSSHASSSFPAPTPPQPTTSQQFYTQPGTSTKMF